MTAKPPLPTDRSFGLTFAAVFAVLTAWLVYTKSSFWLISLAVAAAFALLSLFADRLLHPLNVAWMWFGGVLNRIVSPVVLGVIFFLVFTPVALVFKVRGRDSMSRKFDPSLPTYWLQREPPGPDAPRSFPRQF